MYFKFTPHHIELLKIAKELLISGECTYICHAIKHADLGKNWYEGPKVVSYVGRNLLNYVRMELYGYPTLTNYLRHQPDYQTDRDGANIDNWQDELRICWIDRIIYLVEQHRIGIFNHDNNSHF